MGLRIKDLDLGGIASSFGLLKLPKMPEINKSRIENFEEEQIDLNSVAYRDKTREKERQEKLATYRETGKWPGFKGNKKDTQAWSKKQEMLDKRRAKKMKKFEKRKINAEKDEEEEMDDFEKDFKVMKKFKKGKISQDDFDQAFDL